MTSSSSFLDFLFSSSYLTLASCAAFFFSKASYYFFKFSFWSSLPSILPLISVSSVRLDSKLICRISFSFSSSSFATVYSWTDATWPSVMESFCYISICSFFISALSLSIFCLLSSSCSRDSYKYLYVLATSAFKKEMVWESSLENLRADCSFAAPAMMSLERSRQRPNSFFSCSWECRNARWIRSYSMRNRSKVWSELRLASTSWNSDSSYSYAIVSMPNSSASLSMAVLNIFLSHLSSRKTSSLLAFKIRFNQLALTDLI